MKVRQGWLVAGSAALLLAVAGCGGSSSSKSSGSDGAFDAASYFKGKTVHVIVTHSAGGGSDLYGRYIASKLGAEIPGNPRVTVTNVDGLAGVQDVYKAPEDQLVVGVSSQASLEYTLALEPDAGDFDASKVRMVGGTGGDPRAVTLYGDSAAQYTSLQDLEGKSGPELKWAYTVGAPGDLVSDSYMASWMCDSLKLPCKMSTISNDDSTELNLMVQRKELTAVSSSELSALRDYADGFKDGSIKMIFTHSNDPNTKVVPLAGMDVPDITTMLTPDQTAEYNKILPIISGGNVGKHMWVGTAWPDDALEVMRQAYEKVVSDPANVDKLQTVMSGGSNSDFQYIVKAVSGADAQKLYDEATAKFNKNLSYYKDMETKYFNEYWK